MDRKGLILGIGALLVALGAGSTVRAQTVFIPLAGEGPVVTVEPGFEWTDDDGVTHIRGRIYVGAEVAQDADGVPLTQSTVYVANLNLNFDTGDGDYQAKAVGDPTTYGDLTGSLVGNLDATISGFVLSGTYNYSRGFGDFAGWKHRGTWTSVVGSEWVTFEGYLQIPGGGGGDKAAATESTTLSAVKDLFR